MINEPQVTKSCKYIYNPYQASFYISNGITPLDIKIHYKSKKTYWVFDTIDTEDIYSRWCKSCEDHKNSLVG